MLYISTSIWVLRTEGCVGEQASLGFDMNFGDFLLHKLVQAYYFNMLKYTTDVAFEHV